MTLALCLIGFICGILLLIIAILFIVLALIAEEFSKETRAGFFTSGFIGAFFLAVGIVFCCDGNTSYDKTIKIYSLQTTEHQFILGIGKGNFYYNANNSGLSIEKVSAYNTTLIRDDNIEYPYLHKHKVKWQDKEYSLYVPTDAKIVQYSIK